MAQQPAPLFTLPIPPPISSAPAPGQSAGFFTCTQPSPQVYLLSFSSPPDNRLTPAFNCTFLLALDIIEQRLPRGVVITTSSITKFYSNGLDYENAIKDPNFFVGSLYPLWRRLLTYPMPTIALINGHAFAGGLMTAMMHDYRIMVSPFCQLSSLRSHHSLLQELHSRFKQKARLPVQQSYLCGVATFPPPFTLRFSAAIDLEQSYTMMLSITRTPTADSSL